MPGLVGIVSSRPLSDLIPLLERMTAAVCHFPSYHTQRYVAPDWTLAVGHVHLGLLPAPAGPPRWQHGELTDGFVTIDFDAAARTLTIENDRFGMMPLYYVHQDGRLIFATEPKALLASTLVEPQLDPDGLADLLTFGYILGEKTLVAGVRCLPGGARLRFDLGTNRLDLTRTWDLTQHLGRGARDDRAVLDEVADRFHAAVERACAGEARLGMSLSGGYDSRTIAAAIDHQRHHVETLTLDVPGGEDATIAARIAALTNGSRHHHLIENDAAFFQSWPAAAREMVWLSDGLYYDEACVMMSTLDRYRELGIDVVLRGHGGELARMQWAYELTCNRHVLACRTRDQLLSQLLRQMTCGPGADAADIAAVPSVAEALRDGPRASLAAALVDVDPGWPVLDQVSVVYAREYLRRQSVPSLALLRSRAEVRLPFLDAAYVDAVLQLAPGLRLGTRLHRHLIQRHAPALLRITNSNTGAPAGASDFRQRLSRKTRQLARRWLGRESSRHYVDVPGWLRGPLRSPIEEILLAPRSLDRGLWQPDAVRRLCRDHAEGLADHGPTLLLLVYLELWHRLFVENEPWR